MQDNDPAIAKTFAGRVYNRFFEDGEDVSSPEATAEIAAEVGADREETLAALQNNAIKDRLRAENDAAIARGVFGSPFFFVDGEAFWGSDRLDQVEDWLKGGGW